MVCKMGPRNEVCQAHTVPAAGGKKQPQWGPKQPTSLVQRRLKLEQLMGTMSQTPQGIRSRYQGGISIHLGASSLNLDI